MAFSAWFQTRTSPSSVETARRCPSLDQSANLIVSPSRIDSRGATCRGATLASLARPTHRRPLRLRKHPAPTPRWGKLGLDPRAFLRRNRRQGPSPRFQPPRDLVEFSPQGGRDRARAARCSVDELGDPCVACESPAADLHAPQSSTERPSPKRGSVQALAGNA